MSKVILITVLVLIVYIFFRLSKGKHAALRERRRRILERLRNREGGE